MSSDTIGSARSCPVSATTTPAITTPTAETASPIMCKYALRMFMSRFAPAWRRSPIAAFTTMAMPATTIMTAAFGTSGLRSRPIASQPITIAITASDAALANAASTPMR